MRSSAVLIVSALVARAAASNYTFPAGFNLGEVTPAQKRSWCLAETNTCPQICGGAASPNDCDPDTLNFDCTCVNGTVPDVEPYTNTIPFFVCQANYDQCIQNNPNDLDAQKACKDNANCGSITASVSHASTTTSSAPSSSSTLSTAHAQATTATSASASASAATGTSSPTTGAAVAVQITQGQSAGFLTAAAMAVLGLMM
ncbi:uncharacterized protein TRUGW13939_09641 [Talaromyces rugulosus]|uniref:DUF7707 domain-containing protein n=1 Tax=Talaromyces rugulosus TaxID=121627 RepID=A0A7H8R7X3_TALRU|nr:uncharacterized protein TRUGW13939_09641 [Talaromyces rugulosus]QKX62480.1 hypothetical protein TRUGW13939_09641 [Talaromyces rugulosus]